MKTPTPQPAQADTTAVIAKHRRHVELSPGVGEDVQKYALAVIDDILADLPTPAAHGVGEPTQEMIQAGYEAMRTDNVLDSSEQGRVRRIYKAMLQAASAPGGDHG